MNIKEMYVASNSNEILFNEIRRHLNDCSDTTIKDESGKLIEYGMAFDEEKFITYSTLEEKVKVYKKDIVELSFDKDSPLILFLEQFLIGLKESNDFKNGKTEELEKRIATLEKNQSLWQNSHFVDYMYKCIIAYQKRMSDSGKITINTPKDPQQD